MKKRRGKHKRGEQGSTEDEVNSSKKPNMETADGTNNKDSEVEEIEVNSYETVSEQEPSLKDIKDMLSCVQATLKDIQHKNRKMADELAELKSSFSIQEIQLNSCKESLSKVTKANNAMKLELQVMREEFNKQKSMTDELYESLDNLEQYSRKNSLEIHGRDLYTSPEDVVIKLSELLNEPVRGKDIDITHKIYTGKNKPRNIIVKFISHKKKNCTL